MADETAITNALSQLDPENDNHWTAAGEPRLETVRSVANDQAISREDVKAVDDTFNRQSAKDAAAASVGEQPDPATVTGDPIPPVLNPGQKAAATQPLDSTGKVLPPAPPLPTAPAADGLATAAEPTAVEGGATPGTTADHTTPDVEGSATVGRPPQITEGVTERGVNALNSPEDDLRDAQASTAVSPNAPAELGGTPGARTVGGVTNEAGGDESTEQRPGEAQLAAVDSGSDGDADAVTALEAELEEVSAAAATARAKLDDAQAELALHAAEESRLRVEIEKARPHGGTMPAIQAYFGQIDDTASKLTEARKKITDAGLDYGQLKKVFENSPTGAVK